MPYDTFKKRKGNDPGIGSELGRAGSYPVVYAKLPDPAHRHACRVVAGRSRGTANARELLNTLGLLEP